MGAGGFIDATAEEGMWKVARGSWSEFPELSGVAFRDLHKQDPSLIYQERRADGVLTQES